MALMVEVGLPPATRVEHYEEYVGKSRQARNACRRKHERQAAEDEVLLEAIAQRLGVKVDDLRGRAMRYAALRRAVGGKLRALGWTYYRIALAMDKIPRTVSKWFKVKA